MRVTLPSLSLAACVLALASCDGASTLSAPGGPRLDVGGPSAPTNVYATKNVNGAVRVTFSHDGAGVTHYNFYRRRSQTTSAWVLVRATDNLTLRAFSDKAYDVQWKHWEWRVDACNETACTAGNVHGLTWIGVDAPELRGVNSADSTRIRLHYLDSSNFLIWDYDVNYTAPGWAWNHLITRVNPDGSLTEFVVPVVGTWEYDFTDSTVTPHAAYRYRLQTRNVVGASKAVWEVAVIPGGPAPAAVSAALQPDGLVLVSWAHDGANVTRWYLDRRPQGATQWEMVEPYDTPSLRAVKLRYGVTVDAWEWRVRGCTSNHFEGFRCSASQPAGLTGLQLHPPTNLRVTSSETGAVRLAWDLGAGPVVKTAVYRRTDGSTEWVRLASPAAPRVTYTDTTARAWLKYYYAASSTNGSGESPRGPEIAAGPWDGSSYPPPAAYTDSLRREASGTSVRAYGRALGTPSTPSTAWFEISASPAMTSLEKSAAFTISSSTLTAYSAAFARPAGTWYTRLVAQSERGTTYGAVVQHTDQPPAAPQGITAVLRTDGGVAVRWTHTGAGVYRWVLYRRVKGTTAWTAQVRSSTTNTVRNLVDYVYTGAATGYEWKVDACAVTGLCASSAPVAL